MVYFPFDKTNLVKESIFKLANFSTEEWEFYKQLLEEVSFPKKASKIVQQANLQMALEDQTVDNDMIQFEIKRIARKLVDDMPLDFWDES